MSYSHSPHILLTKQEYLLIPASDSRNKTLENRSQSHFSCSEQNITTTGQTDMTCIHDPHRMIHNHPLTPYPFLYNHQCPKI